ncbi:hypothetical protein HQN87_08180 [Paenibacillus tritici]|uniref:Uncharacterized protein n=1 Tax=Paenibacillus tritici TaxID=1873425 RepID=A0ABX2DL24_9BACL|nr:hypothetical protein [Paenibacillus tritici]NQX45307.1 hypothetical protein [Paenibacillus tritici]
MYRLNVIYRYSEGAEIPKWLIVKPKDGVFDWGIEVASIPLNQPFEQTTPEDINDDALGISILNTELLINTELPEHIGIHLPSVKKRINVLRGEPLAPNFKLLEIEHFVIQMSDLQIMIPNRTLDILSCNWLDF